MSMKVVILRKNYDVEKKVFDTGKFHPGDRLAREFLCYPKGRINFTYIPSDNIFKTDGEVYLSRARVDSNYLESFEKINRTFTYPIWLYESNTLSYFQEADYQISLSGIFEVFRLKDIDHNINNLDDILKHPGIRIVIDHSTLQDMRNMRKDVVLEYERRFRKFNRRKGDENKVFNRGNAVFIATHTHLEYFCLHNYKAGKALHYGTNPFHSVANAFHLSKVALTTVKDVVNIRLMNFWETGHQIRANYLLNKNACSKYLKKKRSSEFSKTSLGDVGAVFLVYVSLMTMSLLVMLGQFRHAFNNRHVERRLQALELQSYSMH